MTTNLTYNQLREWDNNDLIDQIIMLQNELKKWPKEESKFTLFYKHEFPVITHQDKNS